MEHSLNVYECLKDYLNRPRTKNCTAWTIPKPLRDGTAPRHLQGWLLCRGLSQRQNEQGVWKGAHYTVAGHSALWARGKSVYMIQSFMRLTRDEAFAIRYHMGFSGNEDKNSVGRALEMFPLALAVNVADMEATYYLEGSVSDSNTAQSFARRWRKAVRRALCGVAIGA
ncbi:MAG: hydrolase [Ruminococcus callidus]